MNKHHRNLLAAALAAGLGLGAIAQTSQTPPPGVPSGPGGPGLMRGEHAHMDPARMEHFRARMEERQARRLGELKQKLQVTPQQEGAWTAWTAAVKPVQRQRIDRAEMQRLSTPERIDRLKAVRAQRNAEMDKRLDATRTFYTALSTEQKKVFDAEAMRFLRGGKGGRHGGMGRHHG